MSEKEGYPGGCMTASGIMFYPLAPRVDDVRIEDIAHQLAATNRFSGATVYPFSVAQHSVIVSQMMGEENRQSTTPPTVTRALYGLLHDAAEAYLNDIPRPLKHHPDFSCYRFAELRLQTVIYKAFGLDTLEPDDLKTVDRRVLRSEQAALMPPAAPNEDRNDVPVYPQIVFQRWTFEEARNEFLGRFDWLQRQLLAG